MRQKKQEYTKDALIDLDTLPQLRIDQRRITFFEAHGDDRCFGGAGTGSGDAAVVLP